jgi:hypothetical protein
VPWADHVPSQLIARQTPAARPCRAAQLSVAGSGFRFAADRVGGATGTVTVHNSGSKACRLVGRPTVRIVGKSAQPAQREKPLPAQAAVFPEVIPPARTLLALPARAGATLSLEWDNWCPPGAARSAKPLVPPRAIRIELGDGRGSLDVGYNAVPACNAPGRPSTIGVRPFAAAPLSGAAPWTTANIKATIRATSGSEVTGGRGATAKFLVTLRNVDRVPARFGRCPLFVEVVAPVGAPEAHQLNCPAGAAIPPGDALTFEMRVHVPRTAPLGKNGLLWELDPAGSQGPEAVGTLVVSR